MTGSIPSEVAHRSHHHERSTAPAASTSVAGTTDYRQVNRAAWEWLAEVGSSSSRALTEDQVGQGTAWLDPDGWLPWGRFRSVLCLGAGGGQQAPLFAALGYQVTSVDISPSQLRLDRDAARASGVEVELVEADVADLSVLRGRRFDLVYQAISACYVPDVRRMYREVAGVLGPHGHYWVRHWNPVHLQLADEGGWDGSAYRLVRSQYEPGPVVWRTTDARDDREIRCWHYPHRIGDLLGGLGDVGLALVRFAESEPGGVAAAPGSPEHLELYLPTFLTLLARRLDEHPTTTPVVDGQPGPVRSGRPGGSRSG